MTDQIGALLLCLAALALPAVSRCFDYDTTDEENR